MSSFALKKHGLNPAKRSLSVLFLFLLIGLIYVTFGNLLAGAGRIVPFRDQLKMAMSAAWILRIASPFLSCRPCIWQGHARTFIGVWYCNFGTNLLLLPQWVR